jgi:hypothetical protein
LGAVLEARNRRRLSAAARVVMCFGIREQTEQKAAALAALTSFEFFDSLTGGAIDENQANTMVLSLARKFLSTDTALTSL